MNKQIILLTVLFTAAFARAVPVLYAAPARIVSVNVCTDELLPYLVEPSRIAGRTVYSRNLSGLENAALIRGEAEEVLALDPDLVAAGAFTNREMIAMLNRLDVPVIVLDVAENFEAIYRNILKLGEAVGETEKARALIQNMKTSLSAASYLPEEEIPTAVFYQRSGNVPGGQTFQDAVLQASGLRNAAAMNGITGHGILALEDLIKSGPDFLILTDAGAGYYSIGHELLKHPALIKGLPETRRIHIPGELLECGSPRTVDAVKRLREEVRGWE